MFTRVGIELSPVACRVVEIDAGPWRRPSAETRVRSFVRFPLASSRMRAKLRPFRGPNVAVVAWGLPTDHRQVVATQVWAAVQPLVDAGLHVRAVVTPALALMSLARLRRALAVPDVTEAYVALEESAMALVLVRNGALVAARDIAWGYLDGPSAGAQPRPRQDIAARLADELVKFFAAAGAGRGSVAQVCICGGLPELRSMTVPLMERLDLEVETLDSLFGIDAARLPGPADEFRDRGAELRLAWAVAADWPAPFNFLRERNLRQRQQALARAGVVAGVAAGLGVAWGIERIIWRSADVAPVARVTTPASGPRPTREAAPAANPASPRKQAPLDIAHAPLARPAGPPNVAAVTRVPAPLPQPARSPEPALPFDAALGTILYASDRKLAIIDGRIVQPGDDVRGAQVIEIRPASVLLRDGQGRLGFLALPVSRR